MNKLASSPVSAPFHFRPIELLSGLCSRTSRQRLCMLHGSVGMYLIMLVTCRQSAGPIEAVIRGNGFTAARGVLVPLVPRASVSTKQEFTPWRRVAQITASCSRRLPPSSLPRWRVQGYAERFVDDLWSFNVPTRSFPQAPLSGNRLQWARPCKGLSCLICRLHGGHGIRPGPRLGSACFRTCVRDSIMIMYVCMYISHM